MAKRERKTNSKADNKSLSAQVKENAKKEPKKQAEKEGNLTKVVSTGSTLLDLAISGGRVKGGGIPAGILVEIFGPAGCGKTVLLSEIAGGVQRQGGEVMFRDPEARLNKQFAAMFDLDVDAMEYDTPNTVPEVFSKVREWEPKNKKMINGVFADSLAALSTDWEMEGKDGYGMRRAKEFSEELRKTCRVIKENDYLMVCSNQVRVNVDAGQFGQKYISPGGESIGFYSSLRLRAGKPQKINKPKTIKGKEVKRVIGVEVEFEVFKNSVWEPYRTAPLTILFNYGIDDVRENLKFVKRFTGETVYTTGETKLDKSLDNSIYQVEEQDLVEKLREETIQLWHEIEKKFKTKRKKKKR